MKLSGSRRSASRPLFRTPSRAGAPKSTPPVARSPGQESEDEMNRRYGTRTGDDLVEAAHRLLIRLEKSEHAMLIGLPDGCRLSIEIAVLEGP